MAPPRGARSLTVLTYNVGNGLASPERLADFVRRSGADIIGLQEVNGAQAAALDRDSADGYPFRIVRGTGFSGRALLSTLPIIEESWLDLSPGRPDLQAVVEIEGTRLTVVVGHPPPPRLRPRGIIFDPGTSAQIDRLAVLVSSTQPAILLGDFNMTVRNSQYRRLVSAGLVDAARACGARGGSTFPLKLGRMRRLNHHLSWLPLPPFTRVDFIWLTQDIETLDAWVERGAGSDHRPVFARVVL